MKGVLFTELLDMIERDHGLQVLDRVIERARLPNDGAFTAIGSYDWRDLFQLLAQLSTEIGVPVGELERALGRQIFAVFARQYPQLFQGVGNAFDFLASVEDVIHPQMRRLYPDAQLPRFLCARLPGVVELRYFSPRPLVEFAMGMIEGCLEHFGSRARVEYDLLKEGALFVIDEATTPS